MDAKLNPIIGSSAGTPLTGKSISTQSGEQTKSNTQLNPETVQDTLETSDREVDGRLPWDADGSENQPPPESSKPKEQGGLLDLEG